MAFPWRKLNLTALSVFTPICLPVAAQDVSQAELAECAAKASAAEKLACYEALTVISEPVASQPAEPRTPAATGDVTAAQQDVPQEAVVDADPDAAMAVDSARVTEPRADPQPAAPEAPAPVASQPRGPDELGEEHLDRDHAEPDPVAVTATVSDVTESHTGRLYFHFSNGQVWRQIEPRRFRYPKNGEFEVTISQGMMGDYRLRIGGEGPMTRIRRVE